jgi:hypothetical protein
VDIPTTTARRAAVCGLALLAGLAVLATAGWTRDSSDARPTIRIIDVRPLTTNDRALRDLLGHHLLVRVATTDWDLEPSRSNTSGLDPRPLLRHWRLYIDGYPLADSFAGVAYTPYLPAGDHWFVAELRRPDHTSLRPQVWSEPVLLHVPHVFGAGQ